MSQRRPLHRMCTEDSARNGAVPLTSGANVATRTRNTRRGVAYWSWGRDPSHASGAHRSCLSDKSHAPLESRLASPAHRSTHRDKLTPTTLSSPLDADGGGHGGGGAVAVAGMDDAFLSSRGNRCCCFWGPWASSSYAPRSSRGGGGGGRSGGGGVVASCRGEREVIGGERRWWWRHGVNVLMKVWEWSELVAGPRWKTFIRRFRRSPRHHGDSGRLNYDPLSYALNFDEGHGSCRLEDDYHGYCDFSTRFARCPSMVNNVLVATCLINILLFY
ncbi:hypothetical protein ABZP36_021290 [Zizania latifolia]